MQLFEENKERFCCCSEAAKKGIYVKSLENDNFSIYGNLMHNRSILLNYHGKLINSFNKLDYNKSKIPNIYLYYCFDNNWNDKKIINMNVCNSNTYELSYCTIIDIPENENINIAFTNDNDEWDVTEKGTYYLRIYPDVEKAILRRYNLDGVPPVVLSDTLPAKSLSFLKNLKEKAYSFFSIIKIKFFSTV